MKNRNKLCIWDDPATLAMQTLAYEGFTLDTIRKALGFRKLGAVQYRLRKLGVSPAQWRRGKNEQARERILYLLVKCGVRSRRAV